MIVDSMTYDEILDLYWADKPLVNHKMDAGAKFYGRMLKNARVKGRLHYKPIKFKSQRGFNYVMMFFSLADDVPGKERLGVTIMLGSSKIEVCMPSRFRLLTERNIIIPSIILISLRDIGSVS